MRKWFAPLTVAGFALLGAAMTTAHYCVPALRSNSVVSFLVPVKVIVDPPFSNPLMDVDRAAAESAAPWNAGAYALVGMFVALAIKAFRKKV